MRTEAVRKPSSVPLWITPPGRRSFLWDPDYSGPQATNPFRPERNSLRTGRPMVLADQAEPIWSCSGWGLPCPRRHRRGGELLPRRFTLAQMSLRWLELPCHLFLTVGGLFSVALSVPSRGLGVTQHLALWSSDFPHPACLCEARSPEPLQYAITLYHCSMVYCNCFAFTSGSLPKIEARTRP